MSWLRRLSNTLRPERHQRQIDREIAFHVDERTAQLQRAGLSADVSVTTEIRPLPDGSKDSF